MNRSAWFCIAGKAISNWYWNKDAACDECVDAFSPKLNRFTDRFEWRNVFYVWCEFSYDEVPLRCSHHHVDYKCLVLFDSHSRKCSGDFHSLDDTFSVFSFEYSHLLSRWEWLDGWLANSAMFCSAQNWRDFPPLGNVLHHADAAWIHWKHHRRSLCFHHGCYKHREMVSPPPSFTIQRTRHGETRFDNSILSLDFSHCFGSFPCVSDSPKDL